MSEPGKVPHDCRAEGRMVPWTWEEEALVDDPDWGPVQEVFIRVAPRCSECGGPWPFASP